MRVTKNPDGYFFVEDEPMRLDGESAANFLAQMQAPESESAALERVNFLAECDQVYKKALSNLK